MQQACVRLEVLCGGAVLDNQEAFVNALEKTWSKLPENSRFFVTMQWVCVRFMRRLLQNKSFKDLLLDWPQMMMNLLERTAR